VGGHEGGAGLVVGEELVGLLVALADPGDVARELVRFPGLLVEVFGERGAVAGDAVAMRLSCSSLSTYCSRFLRLIL
jgi:hypothetical protein